MHAVLIETEIPEGTSIDAARERLQQNVLPMVREAGASAGYWLGPINTRGVNVTLYDTEDAARAVAQRFTVGQAAPGALEGIVVRLVEVREVVASL